MVRSVIGFPPWSSFSISAGRNLPLQQPLFGGAEKRRGTRSHSAHVASLQGVCILLGDEIFLFGRHQIWTVDREQRLAFANEIASRIGIDFANPPREPRLHVRLTPLIDLHIAVKTQLGA